VLAPQAHFNLFAGNQPPVRFRKQLQKLHGNFFKSEGTSVAAKLVTQRVELEIGESEKDWFHGVSAGGLLREYSTCVGMG
jgi:hypothetical protein